jgi:hypothetical protein
MAPQLPSEHGSDASPLFALHASADFAGSISIHPKDLNLFKLATLAGIRIQWTDNISRHLLLSQRGQRRYVELFALPSILSRGPQDVLSGAGLLSADLLDEIQHSYPNLFNPLPASSLHRWAGMLIALSLWCWCVGCSSRRLALRELRQLKRSTKFYGGCEIRLPYDAVLEELVGAEATAWDRTEFGNLWPRVLALDRCLQEAKPWNFWVLLRDNRDTVQYWTFL